MKTPPANIFVWGLLSETNKEDIIADLSLSGIHIDESSIEKKSKPEAKLSSYRISVPANFLTVALDPSIWPLGVRVREYIFYSKRRENNNDGQESSRQQNGNRTRNQTDFSFHQHQPVGQVAISTDNRFEVLSDNNL